MNKKIYCACCGRQVIQVDHPISSDYYISSHEAVSNFGNTVICRNCAVDLDENGLFPEERELL